MLHFFDRYVKCRGPYKEILLVLMVQDVVVKVGQVLGRDIALQIRSLGRLGKQL